MEPVAEFDQTIDLLLKEIESAPADLELHKQLREVGFRRKVAGGKPAGGFLGPNLPYRGRSDTEKMLNASYVLAKDVVNIPAMMDLYRAAEAAGYEDVMDWIGRILQAATKATKP